MQPTFAKPIAGKIVGKDLLPVVSALFAKLPLHVPERDPLLVGIGEIGHGNFESEALDENLEHSLVGEIEDLGMNRLAFKVGEIAGFPGGSWPLRR